MIEYLIPPLILVTEYFRVRWHRDKNWTIGWLRMMIVLGIVAIVDPSPWGPGAWLLVILSLEAIALLAPEDSAWKRKWLHWSVEETYMEGVLVEKNPCDPIPTSDIFHLLSFLSSYPIYVYCLWDLPYWMWALTAYLAGGIWQVMRPLRWGPSQWRLIYPSFLNRWRPKT